MCRSGILIVFLLLSFSSLRPQSTISGRILNDANDEPVGNVSIYINNTTIGTKSDSSGNYTLSGIKPGVYEIIISHVSFDMLIHRVEAQGKNLRFVFRIIPKIKQMRNIVVMPKELRAKWLATFRTYFLGQSQAAAKSKIKNEDDIFFEKGTKSKSMIAFSETPLIVENRQLGYRIYFELQEFFYDEADGRTYFYGFSRFEELDKREVTKAKWKRNRKANYLGSTQHFYHALLADQLEDQQFSMFLRKPADTVAPEVTRAGGAVTIHFSGQNSTGGPTIAVTAAVKDILFPADSSGERNFLRWKGELVVRYKKNPQEKEYLRRAGHTGGYMAQGVQSGIVMLVPEVYLDPNGCLENPMGVYYNGFWSYERMANMLPIDYRPD